MYENNKDIGWKKKNNGSNGSYDDSLIKNQINILDDKIDDKQDELISGSNIKTINGQSILGNGNITINEGGISELTEPTDLDMPRLYFEGTFPTTKDNVNMKLDYKSKTASFKSYVKIKCQGSSSMNFAKKNFTIQLYSDNAREVAMPVNFKDWGEQSKFCLKANYVDTTHTRNLCGARIAADMVDSRPNSAFTSQLKNIPTSRNGAVDGFPIKVYLNGEFYGIYTCNIPKDGWMFGMDENNSKHWVLCAEKNTDGDSSLINSCQFRRLWTNGNEGDWSQEFGTYSQAVVDSLNRCINFVMTATDEDFHNNIEDYFDLYSLIDYYCFSYLCCHLDGLAKNMLLATYDGVVWGAMLYDMDSCFGAWWTGQSFVSTSYKCPEEYQEQFSLLWSRMEECFSDEIRVRYFELREGALSLSNIITHAEEIYDIIPDRVFNDEHAKWVNLPSVSTNTMTRFRNYMRDRCVYVDAEIVGLGGTIACESLRLNKDSISLGMVQSSGSNSGLSDKDVDYLSGATWSPGTVDGKVGIPGTATTSALNDVCTILYNLPVGVYTFSSTNMKWKKVSVVDETIPSNDKTLLNAHFEGASDSYDVIFPITVPNTKTVLSAFPDGVTDLSELKLYRRNIDDSITDMVDYNIPIADIVAPGWATNKQPDDYLILEYKLGATSSLSDAKPYISTLSFGDAYTTNVINADFNKIEQTPELILSLSTKCYTLEYNNDVYLAVAVPKSIFGNTTTDFFDYCTRNGIANAVINEQSITGDTSVTVLTYQLIATPTPSNTTDNIVWSVSPSGIASVNQKGLVTAVDNGDCTVSATCGGQSASCSVTVSGLSDSGI